MLATYRPLFTSALARRLVATSLSARLAVGVFPLPLVLTVRDATGSYALDYPSQGVPSFARVRGRCRSCSAAFWIRPA